MTSNFEDIIWLANSAFIGGGIFIETNDGYLHEEDFGVFMNNTAENYGDNGATPGVYLLSQRNHSIVYPGQQFEYDLGLFDCFGTLVGWDIYLLYVNTNQQAQFISGISGGVLSNSKTDPLYRLTSASFVGPMEEAKNLYEVDFEIRAESLYPTEAESVYFTLAYCVPGYSYATSEKQCELCNTGQYTLQHSQSCENCPIKGQQCVKSHSSSGSNLNGEFRTIIGPGVWPSPGFENPRSLIPCPNPAACLAVNCSTVLSSDEISWTIDCDNGPYVTNNITQSVYCALGYTDRLCSRCVCSSDANCYFLSDNSCTLCDKASVYSFYLILFGFIFIIGVFFTLPLGGIVLVMGEIGITFILAMLGFTTWISFINSSWMLLLITAMNDKANTGAVKILLTFFQLSLLLVLPDVWPSWFPSNMLGNAAISVSGLDCISPKFAQNPTNKFVFLMSIPVILVLVVVIFSLLGSCIHNLYAKYRERRNKKQLDDVQAQGKTIMPTLSTGTLKAAVFIAYSYYITLAGAVFAVLQPCGDGYLDTIPWLECTWDNSVYVSLFLSATLFLFLYVIGIPTIFALLLYRYRRHLRDDTKIGKAVSFLYEDFRQGMYYYELLWMLRRVLLVMGTILIPRDSIWRYTFCTGVLCIFLFLQTAFRPLAHSAANFAEVFTSLSILTMYGGSVMVAMSNESEEEAGDSVYSNLFALFFLSILAVMFCWTFSPFFIEKIKCCKQRTDTEGTSDQSVPLLDDFASDLLPDHSIN